jgi:hypothetical protein
MRTQALTNTTTPPHHPRHLLVVLGGVAGLEACVDATEGLTVARSGPAVCGASYIRACAPTAC